MWTISDYPPGPRVLKVEEGDHHLNVKHWASKVTIKKLKSQLTEWENSFVDHISDRAQYMGHMKNYYNVRKDNIPAKNRRSRNRHFSKENT